MGLLKRSRNTSASCEGVYCITIDEWSGKQKVAAADHPGAFLYGQVPAAASPREA